MRAESGLQGHHRSETPACHRCGLPLLAEASFCPFCERWLDESRIGRLLHRHGAPAARPDGRVTASPTERVLLAVGIGVFTLVAAVSLIFALTA